MGVVKMQFNLFIIPITMILVQLLKTSEIVPKKWLPWVSVGFGALAGLAFGIYYTQDLFVHVFTGIVYGAAASGIYDAGSVVKTPQEG